MTINSARAFLSSMKRVKPSMVNRSFKYEFEKCSVALALNRGPGYGRWDWSPSRGARKLTRTSGYPKKECGVVWCTCLFLRFLVESCFSSVSFGCWSVCIARDIPLDWFFR